MTIGRGRRRRAVGFTLIELLIVMSVVALLVVMTLPSVSTMAATAKERSVVAKFAQDFDWVRGSSAAKTVSLTLNTDCTWTTTVNGATDTNHSMTSTTLTSAVIRLSCASGSIALPASFSFTSQGFVNPIGTLGFTGAHGQSWPLQILYSGSIVFANGAS